MWRLEDKLVNQHSSRSLNTFRSEVIAFLLGIKLEVSGMKLRGDVLRLERTLTQGEHRRVLAFFAHLDSACLPIKGPEPDKLRMTRGVGPLPSSAETARQERPCNYSASVR